MGFSASLTEVIQSCREFLCVIGLLLNLTTEVVDYLGRCERLSSTHEFFKVCKDVLVCTLSMLQSEVFGICRSYLLHSVSHPTDNIQLQRKVHNNNVDDMKAFRYV